MAERPGTMSLVLFHNPVGRFEYGWRRPDSRVEELLGPALPEHAVRAAEAAHLDAVFFADRMQFDGLLRERGANPDPLMHEPITTVAAMTMCSSRIGLGLTVSTTFSFPYSTARILSQLDHLSAGRVGWNVVTSSGGGANFGGPGGPGLPPKEQRYARAEEFIRACYALWGAWDPDAVVADREAGVWARPASIRDVRFAGEHYRIQDPLAIPPSPQGRPVIFQAGQSADGIAFAARHAEVVFTARSDADSTRAYRAQLKAGAVAAGRRDSDIAVLPGIIPVVADTDEAARELFDSYGELYQERVARSELTALLIGADLVDVGWDEPLPLERLVPPDEVERIEHPLASRYRGLHEEIVRTRPTLREFALERVHADAHQLAIGSVSTVADTMERWFRSGACDGFTLIPAVFPSGVDDICERLVPELVARGLFRSRYEGTTLREHLGTRSTAE